MRSAAVALLALLLFVAWPAGAQPAESDEQLRFLTVRRRQIELKSARTELARARELAAQQLISGMELERVETAVETAQLNYQEAVLALLSVQPRLSVTHALKLQAPDGRKLVRLTVVNLTPTFDDAQFRLLANFEGADPIPEALRKRDLLDVFIALKDAGEPVGAAGSGGRGTTIALPYEVHLPQLAYGESRAFDFQLLRNVNSVRVSMEYKGRHHEVDVELEQAGSEQAVDVTAAQVSQEADLGSQITYDLRLERSTVDNRGFQLKALNLPRQISYSFLEPGSEARLSQIAFDAGVAQLPLRVRLFLPDRADEQVRADAPLEFWVVATELNRTGPFEAERRYSAEEIVRSRAGSVRLTVTPRGVGRIEVVAVSLFAETEAGRAVETTLKVRNTGTRRLDNVHVAAEVPPGWSVELRPATIAALDLRADQDVGLHIVPARDAPVGDYEVRLKTESQAFNRRVPAEDKIFRVSVTARRNLLGLAGVVALLFGLVAGIVVVGMRVTRR